jgi:microcin C transport system permease protein
MLAQGTENLHAHWIVSSAFVAMVLVLTLVTFIGEGVRESFDPKKYTVYK